MSKKAIVIRSFNDKTDFEKDGTNKHYEKDKPFPRPANKKISEERYEELSTAKNALGVPFIKFIDEENEEKNTDKKGSKESE